MARERRKNTEKDTEERKKYSENAQEKARATDKEQGKKENKMRRKLSPDAGIHQAMPILLLLLCAFFGICIYSNISMGLLGGAFRRVCFGLLGGGAYFVPFFFLLWALRWHRAVERNTLVKELSFGIVLLLMIPVLWYTFGVPAEKMYAISEFYAMGVARTGGGLIGNLVGCGLVALVSKVGTVLIAAFTILLLSVLVFGFRYKDIARFLAERARKRRAQRREEAMRRAEERAEKQAEEREARFRGDAALYTAPTAIEGEGTHPTASDDAAVGRNAFLVPATKTGGRGVARQLFDVEAENGLLENGQSERIQKVSSDASAPQPVYDDDFLFDDTAPSAGGGSSSSRVSRAADAYREESQNNTVGESDKEEEAGIPDIPAYRLREDDESPLDARRETEEGRGVAEEQDSGEPQRKAPLLKPQQAEKDSLVDEEEDAVAEEAVLAAEDGENDAFVINKAHVIEHIGADTVGGGDGVFSGRQDSFFHSFPPLSLLQEDTQVSQEDSDQEIKEKSDKLMETLANYGVGAQKSCASRGPRLTRYELIPNKGVRIRAIESLVDEIAMNLEAVSVRIEAPIPGKAAVGVEVPNVKYSSVRLRGLLDTDTFRDAPGKTTVCLGVDVVGVPVFADLEKMPHLLVAGATGMGKSVCINSILVSLLYKARPDEIKLILIDPKKVEFKSYASIPHLLVPVVTEAQKAAGALSWAVNEMERRYDIIERVGVRNIKAYNKTLADHPEREPLPQIVIVIDELHDLMIQAKDAVEDSIARIAAKARAAGIILIIGTQRPSVNVITGVIKANIPSRIAFHVASQIDSRTILDATGAEKLLNNGDMLFLCPGMQMMSPKRVQGAFLDDDEVNRVAEYLRKNSAGVQYNEAVMADMDRESEKYNKDKKQGGDFPSGEASGDVGSEEELLYRAIEVALENGKISTSLLQRKLSVGFGKAARMIDKMEEMGLVSPPNGQKPREILVSMDEYRAMRLKNDE